MTELKVFRPRPVSARASTFNFDRASVVLLGDAKRTFAKPTVLASVALSSEWHDPASVRVADWGTVQGAAQTSAANSATLNTAVAA